MDCVPSAKGPHRARCCSKIGVCPERTEVCPLWESRSDSAPRGTRPHVHMAAQGGGPCPSTPTVQKGPVGRASVPDPLSQKTGRLAPVGVVHPHCTRQGSAMVCKLTPQIPCKLTPQIPVQPVHVQPMEVVMTWRRSMVAWHGGTVVSVVLLAQRDSMVNWTDGGWSVHKRPSLTGWEENSVPLGRPCPNL